jgi:hypothetical protein
MIWLFDLLIAFLTELRAASLINQVMSVLGFIGLLSAIFIFPVRRMRRRAESTLNKIEQLQGRAETAEAANKRLTSERDAALAQLPEAFVTAHATEMRDHNEERAMALAESYITDQQDALSLAFRTRMDEAIRQSPQDGAPAFETALLWARAAQALDPQDRQLLMLIEDLKSAASAAASGARVKLKDGDSRAKRLARNERLPMDVAALETAFYTARDRGEYTLMLFLADHGLTITRRPPFGEGSKEHLLFRRHKAEGLSFVGQAQDALTACEALRVDFQSVFGDRDPNTLYCRLLYTRSLTDGGDNTGALKELSTLLPLMTDVQGPQHSDVLATRALLAKCLAASGDGAAALKELDTLLPLMMEVQGPHHSSTLATRHLRAQCLKDSGDSVGALEELVTLQPLMTDLHDPRHPEVLNTRALLAQCRADSGDGSGALEELDTLLPLMTEVQGPRHPTVLVTRHLLARCRGDSAGTLEELNTLLPLMTEVQGPHHPNVLATRLLRATCLADLDQHERALDDLDSLEQSFDAAGLLPQHNYRTRLEALRDRLSAPPSPDAPPDV